MSTPTRRIAAGCCARAASGHANALRPVIYLSFDVGSYKTRVAESMHFHHDTFP
jgi:hypothetical protein